jgi:DNA-binding GntR family transcriptional regulator
MITDHGQMAWQEARGYRAALDALRRRDAPRAEAAMRADITEAGHEALSFALH